MNKLINGQNKIISKNIEETISKKNIHKNPTIKPANKKSRK